MKIHPFADNHVHLLYTAPKDVSELLDAIADTGVTDANLLAVCPMEEYGILQNDLVLRWKQMYKRIKLRAFGSVHESNDIYGSVPYLKQVQTLLDMGCDGIKFIHMKPDMRKQIGKGINHSDYDEAFSLLEERKTPVIIHSGDPRPFWDIEKADPRDVARGWFYGNGTFLSWEEIYAETLGMLDKHPGLQVTLAHFFFLSDDLEEAKRVMETYPNVRFDLTPGREMYVNFSEKIHAWHDFFETYSDRILFGTDSENLRGPRKIAFVRKALTHDHSEFTDPHFGITVNGLDLSPETVRKICYENYQSFVGPSPVPVNEELLNLAEERLLRDLPEDSAEYALLKTMRAAD